MTTDRSSGGGNGGDFFLCTGQFGRQWCVSSLIGSEEQILVPRWGGAPTTAEVFCVAKMMMVVEPFLY